MVTQPVGVTINEGDKLELTAVASGDTPMAWVWKKGGSAVLGADGTGLTATMVKNVAQLAHDGDYICEFTNAAGTATTDTATVVVVPLPEPPTVTTQPVGVTINEGEALSLSATSTGDTPMNWKWKLGGVDVVGASGTGLVADFSKSAAVLADAGDYTCEFTNDAGTATTDIATVVINDVPDPPKVLSHPEDLNLVEGDNLNLTATAEGDEPISWSWKKDNLDVFGAEGSEHEASLEKLNVQVDDSGDYHCVFENAHGSAETEVAIVNITPPPPVIVKQPESANLSVGDPISLLAEATGEIPITWLWKKDGVEISMAVGTSGFADYTKPMATLEDSGEYTCEFTSNGVTTITNAATITVS
ncbi:immunoglobulin domain-containing protein [Vibrio parahaemolyticus]|uniref:immunoglobulin domain-containing protein n=1 Tax=Vibrio parahaemolyticus TaxID=670 RepID=UPI0021475D22|nr:immunoglobulin domain-containing protein [Vibrio parahaemolyticus]